VEVTAGEKFVVARGGSPANYDDAFQKALLHAQKGLDLMAFEGGNNLIVKGFEDDHLTWWSDANGTTVRMVSLAPVQIDVPPATVKVTDSAGNPVPQPNLSLAWHESFRYFRLSQTTDDLTPIATHTWRSSLS
jgi:hypothetical protein